MCNCIKCDERTSVCDSRLLRDRKGVRRRRRCGSCGEKFITYELALDELEALFREFVASELTDLSNRCGKRVVASLGPYCLKRDLYPGAENADADDADANGVGPVL